MKVYELIQKLCEAPADAEVLVRVTADGMDYAIDIWGIPEQTIGIDFDKEVEICDAYAVKSKGETQIIIDLYTL